MPVQRDKTREHELHLTGTIQEISLMIARIFNRRLKDVGLIHSQWRVLILLESNDGLTQTELADGLAMTQPSLGRLIDRLEEDGWVERRHDPKDRRVKRVFLTQKVTPFIDPLVALVDEIGDIATRGLNQTERNTLGALLEAVHKNLRVSTELDRDGV